MERFNPLTLKLLWNTMFPPDFHTKYKYLGSIPWDEEGDIFLAMEPLIIFMDHKAKPWWCPRWVLRMLHLIGSDNSIVRVYVWWAHNLHRKLTKGIFMWDYKTKWHWYDLRISISGTEEMQDMANMIESHFYNKGYKQDLIERLNELEPGLRYEYWNLDTLVDKYKELTDDGQDKVI